MGLSRPLLLATLIALSGCSSKPTTVKKPLALSSTFKQEVDSVDPRHILFLMSAGKTERALEIYEQYHQLEGQHDFHLLEEMGHILIDQGCRSRDFETGMIGLYGVAMSNLSSTEHILERAIQSPHPNVQLVALQLLSRMNLDSIEDVISKGMSSDFLMIRLETLFHLTQRKSKMALSYIDSLMRLLPPDFRVFFPEFFASLGTPEATHALKDLISDREVQVRLSSLLSTARHMRDDLLPDVRTALSHANPAEIEAAAMAIGLLEDSQSIPRLLELTQSPHESVQLAALTSLVRLGHEPAAAAIRAMGASGNLFAIQAMGSLPLTEETLFALTQSDDPEIRLNAVMALLNKRDERVIDPLIRLLIRDTRDIGFVPQFSHGRAFISWRPIPSAAQQSKKLNVDVEAITWNLKEEMLALSIELSETSFLKLAREVFDKGQVSLVPMVVRLLENIQSPEAIALLQYNANRIGAPFIRGYSLLSLYRLGVSQEYSDKFISWIKTQRGEELIRFRPMAPRTLDLDITANYQLTPEENSALLLESFEALARKHEAASIECILHAIEHGNPKNRPALGGLLLLAIR